MRWCGTTAAAGRFECSIVVRVGGEGAARTESYVKLLVDFDLGHHGFELLGSEHEVEELIGYRVEFGSEVHRFIRERCRARRSIYD